MRPAPVGFQCPDDVAAGSAPSRRAVNPLGGPSTRRRPVVTWTLLALNVVAFVLEGLPLSGLPAVPNDFVQRFVTLPAFPDEPWRLLTGAFLHASIVHIGLNMVALVLLGTQLEQILGRARFVGLYLVSALGGGALYYLLASDNSYQLGASGAIFGMFSAFYLVARRLRVDSSSILVTIGINLVLTVLIPGISLWGHLGGLVIGAALGVVYTRLPARPASWQAVQLGITAALGVALLLVALLPVGAA